MAVLQFRAVLEKIQSKIFCIEIDNFSFFYLTFQAWKPMTHQNQHLFNQEKNHNTKSVSDFLSKRTIQPKIYTKQYFSKALNYAKKKSCKILLIEII